MNQEVEHFTNEQENKIHEIFKQDLNSLFVKLMVSGGMIILTVTGSLFVGFNRLEHVEEQLDLVASAADVNARYTLSTQRDDDLQRQIDTLKTTQDYIRNRVDAIYQLLTK